LRSAGGVEVARRVGKEGEVAGGRVGAARRVALHGARANGGIGVARCVEKEGETAHDCIVGASVGNVEITGIRADEYVAAAAEAVHEGGTTEFDDAVRGIRCGDQGQA